MKPFNLEQALAGEPVKLRDGSKAYVKYIMPEEYKGDYPLRGIYIDSYSDVNISEVMWTKDSFISVDPQYDIIGMWQEPRPRVQLDLPAPLKEQQEDMWYIAGDSVVKSDAFSLTLLKTGKYFATREDAEEWLNALIGARI